MNAHSSFEPGPSVVIGQTQRAKFRFSRVFWTGLILLIMGTGSLTTIMVLAELGVTKDPNPNPVGLGILAFLTFWPSVILIIVGATLSYVRYKSGMRASVDNLKPHAS